MINKSDNCEFDDVDLLTMERLEAICEKEGISLFKVPKKYKYVILFEKGTKSVILHANARNVDVCNFIRYIENGFS